MSQQVISCDMFVISVIYQVAIRHYRIDICGMNFLDRNQRFRPVSAVICIVAIAPGKRFLLLQRNYETILLPDNYSPFKKLAPTFSKGFFSFSIFKDYMGLVIISNAHPSSRQVSVWSIQRQKLHKRLQACQS